MPWYLGVPNRLRVAGAKPLTGLGSDLMLAAGLRFVSATVLNERASYPATVRTDLRLFMDGRKKLSFGANFRHFFIRGLAIVLPTVLTIWLLLAAYQFVQVRIADPINRGLKGLVVRLTPWPVPADSDFDAIRDRLMPAEQDAWQVESERLDRDLGAAYTSTTKISELREWMKRHQDIMMRARYSAVDRWWQSIRIGNWLVMDLIGLVLAIAVIYIAGLILTSFIGRRLYHRGEELINRVPLIRRVYPAVKQVTDFVMGSQREGLSFSRVVAVEYPRKGLWSIGLVTGDTMNVIENRIGQPCLTVFVPSSPTPITGYVISVPKAETIDLPISVEDAMKFSVSGGVVIPPNQQIPNRCDATVSVQNPLASESAARSGAVHPID